MSGSGVGGWNFMEEHFNLPTLFFVLFLTLICAMFLS